jgi:hypothetical protein
MLTQNSYEDHNLVKDLMRKNKNIHKQQSNESCYHASVNISFSTFNSRFNSYDSLDYLEILPTCGASKY